MRSSRGVELRKPGTVGYIRVSTVDQDTEKNRGAVLDYANRMGLGRVSFVEEKVSGSLSWRKRKLAGVVEEMEPGSDLVVPELSRLGRSILDILEVLKILKDRGVRVHGVKEGRVLNGDDVESKVVSTFLALFAEVERDLISMRTKEALRARRDAGVKLGRPRGPGKSRLDPSRDEVLRLLREGVPKTRVAERFGVHEVTLHHWLRKRRLTQSARPGAEEGAGPSRFRRTGEREKGGGER